jgi:hypothetical protein
MEQARRQTLDSARNGNLGDLVRALFEEAWRARRRRRLRWAGVAFSIAVVGAVVFARMQGPAGTNSSQLALGGSSAPVVPVSANEHIEYLHVPSTGKLGSFTVMLLFGSSGTRTWSFSWPATKFDKFDHRRTGQYTKITGGGGRFPVGGHQGAWYARLFGVVSRPGGAKQRVLIKLEGRSNGTFALTPLEPGVLKRDSGTYQSFESG